MAADRALGNFAQHERIDLAAQLDVSIAWEREFLAQPLGPVWTPAFGDAGARSTLIELPAGVDVAR